MRQEKREHSLVGKCRLAYWAIDMFIQQSRMEFSYSCSYVTNFASLLLGPVS